jgi:hypothetical protein
MMSRLQWIYLLDATLLIGACILQAVNFTGLIIHEWLGLAIGILIVPHLLLAWTWIATTTRRLLSGAAGPTPVHTRINYLLNVSLFVCITVQILSGIMISQHAIPLMTSRTAIVLTGDIAWDRIHTTVSDFALVLISLHLAINWNWLVAAVRTRLGWQKAAGR